MYIEVDSRDMAEIRSLVKGWYPHPVTKLVCGFKGEKKHCPLASKVGKFCLRNKEFTYHSLTCSLTYWMQFNGVELKRAKSSACSRSRTEAHDW